MREKSTVTDSGFNAQGSELYQLSDYSSGDCIIFRGFFPASDPFSSKRKWGCISFEGIESVFMGAPEILIGNLPENLEQGLEMGRRVIALGYSGKIWDDDVRLPEIYPLYSVVLEDTIRRDAEKILAFFDLSQQKETLDFDRLCQEYAVFARVTPRQKEELVRALKRRGCQVAMTGDGVNDLLALREADCSIAVADGSDASRQISQMILLNSAFSFLLLWTLEQARRRMTGRLEGK